MRVAGLGELQAKLQKDQRPWAVSVEITRRCNLRCVHCLRGPSCQDDGLSYDEVCHLLDQLVDLGCVKLSFTGGEPFARPDFLRILTVARQQQMASVILTNGALITEAIADTLRDLHVLELRVSLYGASASVHEAVTRVAGSFAKTIRGIRRLADHGLHIGVMMPVLALNVLEVNAVRELCSQLGVTFQRSLVLFPRDDGLDAPLDYMASDEQMCWLANEETECGLPKDEAGGASKLTDERSLCTAGIQQLGVGPEGDVYPCGALRLPAGNIRRQELADIWYSSTVLGEVRHAQRSFPASCSACQVREVCFWCPGLSMAGKGDMTVPNRQDCRRTKLFYGGLDCGRI